MMTMQARESFFPIRHPGLPLRAYPVDSPRAKARLIVLALLADGRVDAAELDGLAKYRAFDELGLTRDDFFQVLYDFCADAARLPEGGGNYLMSPALLEILFAEICSTGERQKLVRLIFDVIRSDGHLAEGEASLFWKALDAWRLRLDDGIEYRPRAAAFRQRGQQRIRSNLS
ncbi:tellurite resistance TerB family protein [Sulfuritalea hydrogenivorans]|jgi:hypothetical protein|uniref:Co-chaperone DjlA N-terminal domain-containing protein n=1 Tax=Sulfuritalea hydrogenivorans sk43H TaxID=1223802 RepID=W0SF37_9PROT|nr:TerB family tellurite resistance protein [Sulfuritalea hydrogenivorans]MDK9715505.1 TerB family tellurite resistance protein [Sulfuritalea sp.]BAO29360.1 hypothetical protein SUTH_01564 [Sulfuritalea hydrogenivorans sk43H]